MNNERKVTLVGCSGARIVLLEHAVRMANHQWFRRKAPWYRKLFNIFFGHALDFVWEGEPMEELRHNFIGLIVAENDIPYINGPPAGSGWLSREEAYKLLGIDEGSA